jgi:protocatechuate 3,4-dioxygenase alpha subunit
MTPSQTIGPFFGHALFQNHYVVPEGAPAAFWIRGRVLDGDGEPVFDAVVETWQAEGWSRCLTDAEGRWGVHTVKPEGSEFIAVSVFARGLLKRLVTRIYPPAAVPSIEFDIVLQGDNETTFYEFV